MAGPRLMGWWFLGTLATGCGPGPVVEIDAGKDYVCARFERGDSACHNYDAAGGPDQWEGSWQWPSLETPQARLVSMSTQYVHLCGLDEGGSVHCTGRKEFYDPVPTGTFTEVTAGSYSTCALDPAGQAHCWGTSFFEDAKQYYKGSDMDPPPGPFRHLFPHDNGYCGLRMDGTLSCWGYNQFGTASPPEAEAFSEVYPSGSLVYCGRSTSGEVLCWGYQSEAPGFQTTLLSLTPFSDAVLGREAACVLREGGEAACATLPDQDPMEYLPPAGVSFLQITAGYRFFCGLTDKPVDGHRVLCWGCRWDDEGVDPALPGQCVPPPW